MSPVDLPTSDYGLYPGYDRHVAQQNLQIVPQSMEFKFNLVHLPLANETITLVPMKREEILAIRHPALADFRVVDGPEREARMAKVKLAPVGQSRTARLVQSGLIGKFSSQGDQGTSLEQQKRIAAGLEAMLQRKPGAQQDMKSDRTVLKAYRAMTEETTRTESVLYTGFSIRPCK